LDDVADRSIWAVIYADAGRLGVAGMAWDSGAGGCGLDVCRYERLAWFCVAVVDCGGRRLFRGG